jgi:hypothetical protein
MYTGPKLHNDQLVFGYDTGYGLDQHSSTRHYKGEPATNLITAGLPGYFGSGGETLYRSNYYGLNSDSGVFQRNFVSNPALSNSNTYNNNAGLYKNFTTAALSSNTEYVLVSFDFYMITPYVRHSSSSTGLNGYMGIQYTDGTTSGIGWNTSLNTPNAGDDWNNNSDYIGQWRKIALYVQVNSSKTPSSISSMYIYNDRTITGEGIFTNFMITEHATVPTGPVNYTSGTRSSTQSIIDLKNTAEINVSNVSFDSTGQPTFDGTDDRISIGDTSFTDFGTNNFTIEAVLYIPSDITTSTGHYKGVVVKKGASSANAGMGIYYNTGHQKFLWSTANGSSSVERFTTNTFGNLLGTYIHVVMIRDSSVTNNGHFYINGVQEAITSGGSLMNVDNNYNLLVGASSTLYSNYFLEGNVPVAKIYNKALSAEEVKQNFNAYKNRFNI